MNELFRTADGSDSIKSERYGVPYHSIHGALTESQHVFISAGLDYVTQKSPRKKIAVLEYGLGSGLNALLAAQYACKNGILINYHAIEKYPIGEAWKELNYCHLIDAPPELFQKIHESSSAFTYKDYFDFQLHRCDFTEADALDLSCDVIFFDAFAPNAQPEVWEEKVLQTCYDRLVSDGVWLSYCAKGAVRRRLEGIGFEMHRIPGPPRKREMLRGIKK